MTLTEKDIKTISNLLIVLSKELKEDITQKVTNQIIASEKRTNDELRSEILESENRTKDNLRSEILESENRTKDELRSKILESENRTKDELSANIVRSEERMKKFVHKSINDHHAEQMELIFKNFASKDDIRSILIETSRNKIDVAKNSHRITLLEK